MLSFGGSEMIRTEAIEQCIQYAAGFGVSMLALHALLSGTFKHTDGRMGRLCKELQRKSFHMIGGAIISAMYQWGMKWGYFAPAHHPELAQRSYLGRTSQPLDAGAAFLSLCFVIWIIEAARLYVPAVKQWYLNSFKGLVREKELTKASGTAYFIPGILAAMLSAPPNVAILSILFLSVGDAAASIGTAVGRIPVSTSSRKFEGSIGCFLVCTGISLRVGLPLNVAVTTSAIVTFGELLAEVIGVDDNLVIPMMGVLGVRIGLNPQFVAMGIMMVVGLAIGVALGMVVGATTPKSAKSK